jgi:hypothetical protein
MTPAMADPVRAHPAPAMFMASGRSPRSPTPRPTSPASTSTASISTAAPR